MLVVEHSSKMNDYLGDRVIIFESNHSISQKISVSRSLYDRAYQICSEETLEDDLFKQLSQIFLYSNPSK